MVSFLCSLTARCYSLFFMKYLTFLYLCFGWVCLFSSCAPSLSDVKREPSQAFQNHTTTLQGRVFEKEAKKHPGKSGFSLIPYGQDAFEKRMRMVALAEKSLDIQYYIWKSDTTGTAFAYEILRAADRGVKVRILLDDLGLKGRDEAIAALDAHPNIEIRIFNPFTSRKLRGVNFLLDFERLNHRMHNKVIVADNAVAIIGGRNIGNHYFSVSKKGNFRDLDIICAGPVVREISGVHDYFWNGKWAVPVKPLVGHVYSKKDLQKRRKKMELAIQKNPVPYELDLNRKDMIAELLKERSRMVWAKGSYVWNDPAELKLSREKQKHTIIRRFESKVRSVKHSVLVENPYFVPKDRWVSVCKDMTNRGVRVRVLTNSMRSNDVLASHAGYARYRKDLIRAGVELYELRPDAKEGKRKSKFSFSGSENAGLHAKAMLFDGESIFVGSFNLDPRSSVINTEGGLYVESRALARDLKDYMDADVQPRNSYRVTLDQKGKLVWTTEVGGKKKVYHTDPQSSVWDDILVGIMQILPIEDQL